MSVTCILHAYTIIITVVHDIFGVCLRSPYAIDYSAGIFSNHIFNG